MRGLWAALACLGLVVAGCGREAEYSQETPDDVVRSAVAMVRDGRASRLDDLFYAEDERMRATLTQLGELLGRLQELAAAVKERFPEQIADLRARAAEAATDGEAGQLILSLGGRSRARGERGGDEAMNDVLTAFLADPYGWLEQGGERLGTMLITDDMASVTLDGKPVFPPIGIMLRREGDKWYVVLPTNLPGLSQYMPRSDVEWSIIGSFFKTMSKSVEELTGDVRAGRIAGIKDLGDKLGEKAMVPAMITFMSYSREMDVRRRRERLQRQFDKRERAWMKAREEAGRPVPAPLRDAMSVLVPPEIEALARKDKRPNIEAMPEDEFAAFLEDVLGRGGLKLSLASATDQEIAVAVSQWEQTRRRSKAGRGGR